MTASIPFGTSLPAVQQIPARVRAWEHAVGGREIIAAAQAAEHAGFAWVSCSDHPLVPVSRAAAMGATWYDAGSTLAFVAGATSRIRLLTHVLVAPYRHPLLVAKQFGTLDHLSGGRVILGVGSGHLKPEFKTLGADYDRRGRVTDDYLQAIVAAWTQDVAAFEGETVRFHDVMLAPRPVQRPHPPIWIGGNSGPALRRAARLGDGWVPWELAPGEFSSFVSRARAVRAEHGRTGPFVAVAPLGVPPSATAATLREEIRTWCSAGATAFHVGIGADSFPGFLDRLAWFGAEVIRGVG